MTNGSNIIFLIYKCQYFKYNTAHKYLLINTIRKHTELFELRNIYNYFEQPGN